MPTVRVDDEVYAWLQGQARPFEDTPNSVLRRVAQLDKSDNGEEDDAQMRHMTGKKLNFDWNVGALHALYHRHGKWYNNLQRFPGALFDPTGYILFASEDDYKNCPYIRIGVETNVPDEISGIPGYVKVK